MTITSSHNDKLKEIRKLGRRRERERTGRFVAEGEDLIAAATAAGWEPVHLLVAAGSGLDGEEVEGALLDGVSALGSGSRVIGVYESRWAAPAGPVCVCLHGLGDPGNVGAVLRSAHAFGAGSVVLGPGCADPFGRKAVRASMGAVFAVPLARTDGVAGLPGERVALDAGEGVPLTEWARTRSGEPAGSGAVTGSGALPGPAAAASLAALPGSGAVTLVIGAERSGLPRDVLQACEHVVHIPIVSESLNAAMAATVALYELSRSDGTPAAC